MDIIIQWINAKMKNLAFHQLVIYVVQMDIVHASNNHTG